MIYLENTTNSQQMFIPRSVTDVDGTLTLKLTSTVNLTYEVTDITDIGTTDLYFRVAIALPEGLPDGEYEYEVLSDDDVVSTGILVLVTETTTTEYNKEIEYEQYESE